MQRGLLGAVALVVDRRTIAMRPTGLVGVDLHALSTRSLGCYSLSRRSLQRIRHWGDIQVQCQSGDPEAVPLGPRAVGRLDQEGRKRLSTAALTVPLTQDARGGG